MKFTFILIFFTFLVLGLNTSLISQPSFSINGEDPPALNYEVEQQHKIIFHWEDRFNKKEKAKIKEWLNRTTQAVQNVLGNYPFDLHFYIHRAENSRGPVPWANTERSETQGVNFHVNPDFSLEELLNDWTAPHEISHLAIPFLGPENAWFAEGFATYMQGQILIEMKEFTSQQIQDKYERKLTNALPYYQSNSPFIDVADSLRRNHHYPEMYWGSVTFFDNLNQHLQNTKEKSLNELLQKYQKCCRLKDETLNDLMKSFDELGDDTYAQKLLSSYQNEPAKDVMPKH